jgi:hypothetical protein
VTIIHGSGVQIPPPYQNQGLRRLRAPFSCCNALATNEGIATVSAGARQLHATRLQRSVVGPPGVDGSPPLSQVRLCAVAVELDLVDPARARRNLLALRRMTRLDEAAERRRPCTGQRTCIKTRRRPARRYPTHGGAHIGGNRHPERRASLKFGEHVRLHYASRRDLCQDVILGKAQR